MPRTASTRMRERVLGIEGNPLFVLTNCRIFCEAGSEARMTVVCADSRRLSLGERVGFSVSVLGQQIDFSVVCNQ